jgi:hypothetical protein
MLEDLCAVQQTLEQCLQIRDEPHLRGWYQLLDETLPQYQPLFGEVERALSWVDGIAEILDVPLPTADNPGSGGDEVARRLAHYLGSLATLDDLSPWLTQFRKDLFARSERIGLACFIATISWGCRAATTSTRAYMVKPSVN